MRLQKWMLLFFLAFSPIFTGTHALAQEGGDLGQVLKIRLNITSFTGEPSWLIVIRDVDHDQNIPYMYDITQNEDYWLALTYGHEYYVISSELTLNPYERSIKNFCGLESMGRILRGVSMDIQVRGRITKNPNTVTCQVLRYSDPTFNVAPQD